MLDLDKFLQFWTNHNEIIIQSCFLIILIAVLIIVFRYVFGAKENLFQNDNNNNFDQLEKTLKEVLNKGNISVSSNGSFDKQENTNNDEDIIKVVSQKDLEINNLIKDLKEREEDISKLKQLLEDTDPSSMAEAEKQRYEEKINELESKLQEYEVIEEDIADLSTYKEENLKLKKEIEDIKKNFGSIDLDNSLKSKNEINENEVDKIKDLEKISKQKIEENQNNVDNLQNKHDFEQPILQADNDSKDNDDIKNSEKNNEDDFFQQISEESNLNDKEEVNEYVDDDIMEQFAKQINKKKENNNNTVEKKIIEKKIRQEEISSDKEKKILENQINEEKNKNNIQNMKKNNQFSVNQKRKDKKMNKASSLEEEFEGQTDDIIADLSANIENEKDDEINFDKILEEAEDLNNKNINEEKNIDIFNSHLDTDKVQKEALELDEKIRNEK